MKNLFLTFPLLLALAACSEEGDFSDDESEADDRAPVHGMGMGNREEGPTLVFSAPSDWKSHPVMPGGMVPRKAQFAVPDREKKEADAQMVYFSGVGGGVEGNLDRWKTQFPKVTVEPKVETFKAGDLSVWLLDLTGQYSPDSGDKQSSETRFLGAIAEAPGGDLHFFKLVGPAGTVGDWRDAFAEMLKTLRLP